MPREPWVKVKIGARRSGKLAALPSDTARLGYFYTLLEAKVQRVMGVFENDGHFVEVLGRFGKHLPQYLDTGLVHRAPLSCRDCAARHPDAKPGQLVVHDYLREQRDPTAADRMADMRDRHGDADGDADVTPDSVTNGVTDTVTPADPRYGDVTPTVTGDSRARATTATGTETLTEESSSRGSTRPSTSRGARAADGPVDPSTEDEPWAAAASR